MKLTRRLLSYLNRVFDKDPVQFLALRLSYTGGTMSWSIEDAVLRTTVHGGVGHNLEVDLSQYTVATLANYLAMQPGYSILALDTSDLAQLSARVLLDGGADIASSNGDHLYGYTSILFSYLEAMASELALARIQLGEMLKQMSTKTAEETWLDELGGYYGVPRLAGEVDASYGPRIIAEVLRPRGNNVAIALAIKAYTGQDSTVVDVVEYTSGAATFNGAVNFSGGITYSGGGLGTPRYGLFDVRYGYDLINGAGDINTFAATVRDLIGRLRDAGTHLRALTLTGSVMNDDADPPTDGVMTLAAGVSLTDTMDAPTEASVMNADAQFADSLTAPGDTSGLGLDVSYNYVYDGFRSYDGAITYSGTVISETL